MDDKGLTSQEIIAEGGSTISGVTQIITDKYYSRSQAEELSEYLKHAIAAYEARMYQLVARPAAPPDQPYKFLYAFEIEDADIFFGRGVASQAFHQTLLKDRLTVLHARSGAGKTSLLNAGLLPRLIREGHLPVCARAYEDPVLAIKRAIAPPSLGPWPKLLPKLTLHEFLGLTCAHLSRQTQELVVILDQFEEFFIFWPERDHRQPFIDALADCYDDKALPVRLIIALRKDYYSDLATFQHRLPHIFHNEYYLEAMTREEAQAAIACPVAKLGRPVAYEPVLLDTLLDDLARGGMELPHLQIICTRLYEMLAEGETAISLASYEELGQAEGVLGGYLNSVLDRQPGKGGAIAREVLKELVSSEATKRVLSYGTLAARVEAEGDELDGVLTQLVDARLLSRDEVEGEIVYEMAHEYLIEEIKKWIDLADLEFKRAEELLRREVANWRVHGTPIPRDRLELIYAHRERLRGLDDEAWECILLSALQAEFALEDWVKLAGEVGEKLLLAALDDPREEMRRAIIRNLGAIWGLPEVSRLGDEDFDVRWKAAEVLGKPGDSRAVEPLIAALRDEDFDVRWKAAEALGELGDPRAVEPLIATLRDKDWEMREVGAEALVNIGEPAMEPLIVALRDEDSNVRRAAAEALRWIGAPRAVEPLSAALRDEDWHVREMAAEALGELGDPRAVESIVAALRDEDSKIHQVAVKALGEIGKPAMESLITALQDKSWHVRRAVAEALGKLGDPRAVESLIAALGDRNWYVRQAAAKALGELGDPRAVEPLSAALRDEDWHVRKMAAEALRELGDPRAVEPLSAILWDEDRGVRWAAAWALGKLGDPRAVEPFITSLRDKNSYVRERAAEALGKLGNRRAVEPLSAALRDEDWHVRRMAAEALGKLGEPAVEPLSTALRDEDWHVRRMAAEALGKLGEPAVEPLSTALRDEIGSVRWEAAVTLKKIGTPEALAALEHFKSGGIE